MWPILGPIGKGNPIVGAEGKESSDNGRDSLVIKTLNDDYRRRPVDDEELSFDDVNNLNEMFDNMIKSLDDGSIYEGGIKGDGGESAVAQDENDAVKLAAVVNELNALRAQFFSVTKEVEVVNDRIRGLEGTEGYSLRAMAGWLLSSTSVLGRVWYVSSSPRSCFSSRMTACLWYRCFA